MKWFGKGLVHLIHAVMFIHRLTQLSCFIVEHKGEKQIKTMNTRELTLA